jgi:uncharacterized protein (DUF433 family)
MIPLLRLDTMMNVNEILMPEPSVMVLPEFLTEKQGEVLLRGHRVGLFHVVKRYNDGYSVEMIACHYPTLGLALLHKVIAFYLENRQEVDAYVQQCDASLEQLRRSGGVDLAELRARLTASPSPEGVTAAETE